MPALPVVPKVLRIDNHFTIGEDLAAKVRLFYSYSGTAPTQAQLDAFASATFTNNGTALKTQMTPDRILTSIVVTDLSSPTSPQSVFTGSTAGTAVGPKLPADVCVLESFQIGRRFRGGHPRAYWPIGSQSDMADAQTWLPASVTAFSNTFGTIDNDIELNVWTGGGLLDGVTVSYYSGFTVHTGITGRARNISTVRLAPVVDTWTTFIVRAGIASQRKRLLRLA